MKKTLSISQILGFIFTSIAGVILHFLYDWTNQNTFIAAFSAVNESTWEHMKLLFFPMFIYALIQRRYKGKEYKNFWCVKLIGIVLGLLLIPGLYYTINGAFGMTPDWVNIAIFFVTAGICYFVETKLFERGINCKSQGIALLILWLIALVFVIFTFFPLSIPLFEDPTQYLN